MFRQFVHSLTLACLAGLIAPAAAAQDNPRSQFRVPDAGTPVPDVTVYDESGEEFSLRELRGQYSVLVFGCLT